MFALWKKFNLQEKYGKRTAEDDIFSGFKKKKGEGEGKAALIPREVSLLVFMGNITTNHAITYANLWVNRNPLSFFLLNLL